MKRIYFILFAAVLFSGCKVKYSEFAANYPNRVNWNVRSEPLPIAAHPRVITDSANKTAPNTNDLTASADKDIVPLPNKTTSPVIDVNLLKIGLERKIQESKAFQKMKPQRQEKIMAKVEKLTTKLAQFMAPRTGGTGGGGRGLAIASLSMGLLGLLLLPVMFANVGPLSVAILVLVPFLALAAIITGAIALRRSSRGTPEHKMAASGVAFGALALVLDLIFVALVIAVAGIFLLL